MKKKQISIYLDLEVANALSEVSDNPSVAVTRLVQQRGDFAEMDQKIESILKGTRMIYQEIQTKRRRSIEKRN